MVRKWIWVRLKPGNMNHRIDSTQPAPRSGDRKPRKLRTVIVELDSDGDPWLRTGKRARRQLTRAEFFELANRGSVVVTRAK